MGLFDRKTPPPTQRTIEERERARAEREALRAQREGPPLEGTMPPPVRTPPPRPVDEPVVARGDHAPSVDEPVVARGDHAPSVDEPPAETAQPSRGTTAPAPPARPVRPTEAPSVVLDRETVEDWSALDEPPPDSHPKRWSSGDRGGTATRVLAGLALVVGLAALWFAFALFQPFHGAGGARVAVAIPRGATVADAGRRLAEHHVISSPLLFRLRVQLAGADIKPGAYQLRSGMTYGAALDALSKGPPPARTTNITITEGRTRHEVSRLLAHTSLRGSYGAATRRSGFLDPQAYGAPATTPSLEGFLFPATYQVRVGAPVSELVRKQLSTFKQRFARVDLGYARSKHLTPYDVLIVASMVEREAAVPGDRRLVAAVIYNRLKIGYPLGIDATLRYALNNQTRALRESELRLDSPYNTRIHRGLPPTPIGNPGMAAIEAAAHPAQSRVLYFVVKPGTCGEHAFSTSFEQFQRDAARYSQARAAKGGRSPVKCG
ncbi:MAG: endolytic transglycosylase MltG [Solirubrobacteraceae bacterium]